jgi:hypothetical protein
MIKTTSDFLLRRDVNHSLCDSVQNGYTLLVLVIESFCMVLSVPNNRCISYIIHTPALNLLTQPVRTSPTPTLVYFPSSLVGTTNSM